MADALGKTMTLRPDRVDGGVAREPQLYVVLEAGRPAAGGGRHSLARLDEVRLERGPRREVERDAEGRRLHLRIPDAWMSSDHATLRRQRTRWVLEDNGSKNGSSVNGAAQARALLKDGDLIELGGTFCVFRDAVAVTEDDALDLDGSDLDAPPGLATLVPELARRFAELAKMAPSSAPILVRGATGTGKELVARAVHGLSGRTGPFVPVNCGAIATSVLQSELFGYKKGAFSDAKQDRDGLIAAADGGTLMLDEIGELSAEAQKALLRVLQEGEVRPLGATSATPVDVRVVAATHRPLDALVAEEAFRADLLERLSGYALVLPELRARREDFGLILAALVADIGSPVELTGAAARALLSYDWPRNVRQLRNALVRAATLSDGATVELAHLPEPIREARPAEPARTPLSGEDRARYDELVAQLERHRGNITHVARAMGKVRTQIQRWLKRYGIDADEFRG